MRERHAIPPRFPEEPAIELSSPQDWTAVLRDSVSSGSIELPVLPAAVAEVLACVDGDDCDAQSLAALIQRDPSLTANLLRVANSARYCPKEPIVSLHQAISRLGLSKLREMALMVAVKGAVFNVPRHGPFVACLWRHAQAVGGLSREVARTRRGNVEAAFLCGLLHDIGAPVILQGLVDLARKTGRPLDAACIDHAIEQLHGMVGAEMVKAWKLPAWIEQVVLHHHDPAGASTHFDLVQTVALSDALADWLVDGGGEGDRPGADLLHLLDLYEDDLDALCSKAPTIVSEMAA